MQLFSVSHYFFLSGGLFLIGVAGALLRRNAAFVAMSIALMATAATINFAAFSRFFGDPAGQNFSVILTIVAIAEALVFMALLGTYSKPGAAIPAPQSPPEPSFEPTPAPTDSAE
ncbi:MAG TPA: NADH-quinone oxidoreductase subunit K [Candidatus Saccharimonadales bacterium]|nr:NADH-quinone oxidoreductase subunit K [Candidatus Saccharimonadales bacterium]